jgi:hypothetical protein
MFVSVADFLMHAEECRKIPSALHQVRLEDPYDQRAGHLLPVLHSLFQLPNTSHLTCRRQGLEFESCVVQFIREIAGALSVHIQGLLCLPLRYTC